MLVQVIGGADDAIWPRQIGGTGQQHEIEAVIGGIGNTVGPGIEQGVVGLQRDKDRAIAAFGHQVEAVIEELTKEREPGIERGPQTRVRCDVGNEKDRRIVGRAEFSIQSWAIDECGAWISLWIGRRDGCRVIGRLVDDQVGDEARLRSSNTKPLVCV